MEATLQPRLVAELDNSVEVELGDAVVVVLVKDAAVWCANPTVPFSKL
jgi:hypothetical protein